MTCSLAPCKFLTGSNKQQPITQSNWQVFIDLHVSMVSGYWNPPWVLFFGIFGCQLLVKVGELRKEKKVWVPHGQRLPTWAYGNNCKPLMLRYTATIGRLKLGPVPGKTLRRLLRKANPENLLLRLTATIPWIALQHVKVVGHGWRANKGWSWSQMLNRGQSWLMMLNNENHDYDRMCDQHVRALANYYSGWFLLLSLWFQSVAKEVPAMKSNVDVTPTRPCSPGLPHGCTASTSNGSGAVRTTAETAAKKWPQGPSRGTSDGWSASTVKHLVELFGFASATEFWGSESRLDDLVEKICWKNCGGWSLQQTRINLWFFG